MKQSDIEVGTKLVHKFIGDCEYTEECAFLQAVQGSDDGLYVEQDGDVKEVTFSLLSVKEG